MSGTYIAADKCFLHDLHLKGQVSCAGEAVRKLTKRSRLVPGKSMLVSPMGDVFRVLEVDRKRNSIVYTPPSDMGSTEAGDYYRIGNRLSALIAADYRYTNDADEQEKLLDNLPQEDNDV